MLLSIDLYYLQVIPVYFGCQTNDAWRILTILISINFKFRHTRETGIQDVGNRHACSLLVPTFAGMTR